MSKDASEAGNSTCEGSMITSNEGETKTTTLLQEFDSFYEKAKREPTFVNKDWESLRDDLITWLVSEGVEQGEPEEVKRKAAESSKKLVIRRTASQHQEAISALSKRLGNKLTIST